MKSLFLTGYGLSIGVKKTRLFFRQGIKDPFHKEKQEELEIPPSAANFDKVVIQGRGYVQCFLYHLAVPKVSLNKPDSRFVRGKGVFGCRNRNCDFSRYFCTRTNPSERYLVNRTVVRAGDRAELLVQTRYTV